MAATRRNMEMVENNQRLRYITDAQLRVMRADIRAARRIAYAEYERLDLIIRHGAHEARANNNVAALQTMHDNLNQEERDELYADPPPIVPPQSGIGSTVCVICVAFIMGMISTNAVVNANF